MISLYNRILEFAQNKGLLATIAAGPFYLSRALPPMLKDEIEPRSMVIAKAFEFSSDHDVPLSQSLTAARKGFKAEDYYLLGLQDRNEEHYLSSQRPFERLQPTAVPVLQDKIAVYSIFDEIAQFFPTLYGTIHNESYFSHDGTTTSLRDAVDMYADVVAKPISKYEGTGFFHLKLADPYTLNGDAISVEYLDRLTEIHELTDYMVTEYIQQHSYAESIFDGSANTIRLLTAIDASTGEPVVVRAAHRFGTSTSEPVDNVAKGGLAAPIDIESGEIGQLVTLQHGRRTLLDNHPESGVSVSETVIPFWDEIKSITRQGANAYPTARLIGWDIIVSDDGPRIIEASAHPGIKTLQLEEGLLENEVVSMLLDGYV